MVNKDLETPSEKNKHIPHSWGTVVTPRVAPKDVTTKSGEITSIAMQESKELARLFGRSGQAMVLSKEFEELNARFEARFYGIK